MSASTHQGASDFARAMGPVALELLGEATEKSETELKFGTRCSMCIDLKKGTWFDFEANAGGGVLDFVQLQRSVDRDGALDWLRDRKHLPSPSGKLNIVASYPYTDAGGKLLFEVIRVEPKDFRQRRPDGNGGWLWNMKGIQRVIYRLPSVVAAVKAGAVVYVTEGEKAADLLAGWGLPATCSPGGARKWRREYATFLAGADVVILPDNDESGRSHGDMVAVSLRSAPGGAKRVRVLTLPDLPLKGDVADWIAAGGTAEELAKLTETAPEAGDTRTAKPIVDLNGFDLTEDGIALAFTAEHQDLLRFDHTRGAWFQWTGKAWRQDETKLAFSWSRRICRRLAKQADAEGKVLAIMAKAATAASVERFAQSDPALAVTSAIWDRDPFLLGTPGGTVDLRTGELREPASDDHITKLTAVAPALMPECPMWLAFLEQATNGDNGLIRFLRQWCGYCLTGDTREHALLFGYGSGGNGKGVFLNTVSRIMGEYARNAAMDTFTASATDKHPTDLAMLRGARLVTASETEEGRAWAEARIKALTGGDTITARFMRQDFFEYVPHFKLTIIGNHKPVLKNVDDAARRRFNVVPFVHKPAKPDLQLEHKLKAEWPAILRWMIEGCLDWQMHGLVRPDVVKNATADYFSEQDTVNQWVTEFCTVGVTESDTLDSLFKSWTAYAMANGEKPGASKWFSQTLSRLGCEAVKNTPGNHGKRGFIGITVTPMAGYARHEPVGDRD